MDINNLYKILYILVRDITFWDYPGFRKIRNGIYSKYLNSVDINVDSRVRIGKSHYSNNTKIDIGKSLRIGLDAKIDLSGGLILGNNVTISEGVKIYTHEHNVDGRHVNWRKDGIELSPLEIESCAWIGANAIITASVNKIGRGAIVGAGSVVTQDIEPFSIVAGVPAKHLRYRNLQ